MADEQPTSQEAPKPAEAEAPAPASDAPETPATPEAPTTPEAPEAPPEPVAPVATAAPAVSETGPKTYTWGTGRRKKAIARVRIAPGTGKILINKREVDDFFKCPQDQAAVRSPLEAAQAVGRFDVWVNVKGGGTTGQAGAVLLGLARALAKALPDADHALRDQDLMTRDARIKERKKFGRRGARRGLQWAKR